MIPALIHQMFINPFDGSLDGLNDDVRRQCHLWMEHHPGYRYRMWGLQEFLRLCLRESRADVADTVLACRFPAMQADIARLLILKTFGGFWADLKMIPLQPFLESLREHELVLAEHFIKEGWHPGLPCSAFLGAQSGHDFFDAALDLAMRRVAERTPQTFRVAGPAALEECLSDPRYRHLHILPQSETWGKLFDVGSGSYNHGQDSLHWSRRELRESPYVDSADLLASRMADRLAARDNRVMPVSADSFDSWISAMIGLLQPATVCDIGPGAGKYGKIVKRVAGQRGFETRVTGIEIDPSYIEEFGLRSIYDEVIVGDAVNLISTPRIRFDLVIIGDCIEHMRKSMALDLLNFLVYRTGYICIVYPEEAVQDDWEGHAAEAHISTWSAGDFAGWDTLHLTAEHPWCKLNLFLVKGYQRSRVAIDADAVASAQQQGDPLAAIEAELATRPGDPRLYDRLGYALLEAKQPGPAIRIFLAGLQHAPDDAELLFKLSHAYVQAQRQSEALDAAERSVVIRPDEFHPQMHYGYLLTGAGLLERAAAAFLNAERQRPGDSVAPAALADVLERIGRTEQALMAAERAAALAPDDATCSARCKRLRARLTAAGTTVPRGEHATGP